jgi:hypothetical protein
MPVRRLALALAIAALAVLMGSLTAYAAMDATLSSDHARPGDWILLLTDDNSGRAIYGDLSAEGNQPIYLAPVTNDPTAGCGGVGSNMVGLLAWRGNRGGVAFRAPSLPARNYYLFIDTHSQCWRIGGTVSGIHGPLVLAIGSIAAVNQDVAANWSVESLGPPQQQPSQQPGQLVAAPASVGQRLLVIGAIVLAALLVALAAWWQWRRHARS